MLKRQEPGTVAGIAPGVRCLLAPNPGPMTYWGTNTYILGEKDVAVIDPGPLSEAHIAALLGAVSPGRVTHILVTHAHLDHSQGAAHLASRTGATVYAFGPANAAQRAVPSAFSALAPHAGSEGTDHGFAPDVSVAEGDIIETGEWRLKVLHLPGHFAGHLGFLGGDSLFSGDHVMDWATTIVSPPDGHLGDFLKSSQRLMELAPRRCLTGHGAPIDDVAGRLEWLMSHRKSREAQIREIISRHPSTIEELVQSIYREVPREMHPAAARNVLAHLINLHDRALVDIDGRVETAPRFSAA